MKKEIKTALLILAARVAEINQYNWNTDFKLESLKSVWENIQSNLKLDFNELTIKDCEDLGFLLWRSDQSVDKDLEILGLNLQRGKISQEDFDKESTKLLNQKNLWTIPLYLFQSLPEGLVVTCISGELCTVGKDSIDDDNRRGCIAYGIHPKESDFKERLKKEYFGLADKVTKLEKALSTDGFAQKVGDYQYKLMREQLVGMQKYLLALTDRVKDMNLV